MYTYLIHFKANESLEVSAMNGALAQEVAIEAYENVGIPHSEIVAIVRVNREPASGQYMGMNGEFACYYNVSL